MESISNIWIYTAYTWSQKRDDIQKIIKCIYENEENKTITESTVTDRITFADTNVLEDKCLEEKEVSPEGNNFANLSQEEINYLREESKERSEKIRMLSGKQNTYRCLHTNTTEAAVPGK